MNIMLILCKQRELDPLVDELEDWKEEGAHPFMHGITAKAQQGFIFLEWGKPIPQRFHQKLRDDADVIDYFTFSNLIITPRQHTVVGRD